VATEVLQKLGTQIAFYVTGDYSPADAGTDFKIGSPTEVVLTLSAVANGAGRQSAKADLGATRARAYECLAAVDFTGETPTVGGTVDIYWAPSTSGTAATGNVAGNSGGDGAAPDGALGSITLAEFIRQCIYIGSLIVHDGASVQNGFVGVLAPTTRYGQIVLVNNSGDAFEADNVEMGVFLTPIVDEIQDA
jgi:hypothetical protein